MVATSLGQGEKLSLTGPEQLETNDKLQSRRRNKPPLLCLLEVQGT